MDTYHIQLAQKSFESILRKGETFAGETSLDREGTTNSTNGATTRTRTIQD